MDEAQDLNFAQYALIRALAAPNGNVLMVGSPNQAIYGFNGSDTRYMLQDFREDFKVTRYELTENYRSAKTIIRAANTLFPGDVMDESAAPIGGECLVKALPNEQEEAAWVVGRISDLLAAGKHPDIEGPLTLKSMAVLARNRYVFSAVDSALEGAGMPHYYRRSSTDPVLESDFAQCFDLGLRMLVNPLDRLHWRQLCELLACGPGAGTGKTGMDLLRSVASRVRTDWEHSFAALVAAWSSVDNNVSTFSKAVDDLRQHCLSDARLNGATADAAERALILEDLEFLRENWRKYILATQPDARTLSHFRNQMAMGLTTPLDERDGVPLATVHSVKGLEYDVVFLIGMTEGTFPDYRAVTQGGKALEEEKNDAYVAITRARRLLYITYPQNRVMPWDKGAGTTTRQQRSRFLAVLTSYGTGKEEQPPSLMVAER